MDNTRGEVLAIDPGNKDSAYVFMDKQFLQPLQFGILENEKVLKLAEKLNHNDILAVEMVASYGMPVGESVFETVFWIGQFWKAGENAGERVKVYRKDVKMKLCQSMKAKDSNIRQSLIDRFGVVGTKKQPGWFYGFKKDIWQAYAVGVTYLDWRGRK